MNKNDERKETLDISRDKISTAAPMKDISKR